MQRMLARVVRTSPIRPAGVFVRPTLEVGPSALLPAQGAVSSSRWQQLHCAAGARGYTSSSSSSLPSAPYYSADSHNHPLLGAHNVFRQHSLGRTVHQVRLANIPSHDPSNTPHYLLPPERAGSPLPSPHCAALGDRGNVFRDGGYLCCTLASTVPSALAYNHGNGDGNATRTKLLVG